MQKIRPPRRSTTQNNRAKAAEFIAYLFVQKYSSKATQTSTTPQWGLLRFSHLRIFFLFFVSFANTSRNARHTNTGEDTHRTTQHTFVTEMKWSGYWRIALSSSRWVSKRNASRLSGTFVFLRVGGESAPKGDVGGEDVRVQTQTTRPCFFSALFSRSFNFRCSYYFWKKKRLINHPRNIHACIHQRRHDDTSKNHNINSVGKNRRSSRTPARSLDVVADRAWQVPVLAEPVHLVLVVEAAHLHAVRGNLTHVGGGQLPDLGEERGERVELCQSVRVSGIQFTDTIMETSVDASDYHTVRHILQKKGFTWAAMLYSSMRGSRV